jgi:hypothetical protein
MVEPGRGFVELGEAYFDGMIGAELALAKLAAP